MASGVERSYICRGMLTSQVVLTVGPMYVGLGRVIYTWGRREHIYMYVLRRVSSCFEFFLFFFFRVGFLGSMDMCMLVLCVGFYVVVVLYGIYMCGIRRFVHGWVEWVGEVGMNVAVGHGVLLYGVCMY